MTKGLLSQKQIGFLLKGIKPNRVLNDGKGHSHVSQQDVTAHLIRMFGFGNFTIDVNSVDLIFEEPRMNGDKPSGRWDVCYKAIIRLTIYNAEGEFVAYYENGSTATAQNQTRGDAHDLAYKSAISLSIKRAAIALGDQFGLSLYNKGQIAPLVIDTVVGGNADETIQDKIPQQVSLGNDEIAPDDEDVRPAQASAAPRQPAGTRAPANAPETGAGGLAAGFKHPEGRE